MSKTALKDKKLLWKTKRSNNSTLSYSFEGQSQACIKSNSCVFCTKLYEGWRTTSVCQSSRMITLEFIWEDTVIYQNNKIACPSQYRRLLVVRLFGIHCPHCPVLSTLA
ncbi:hypothetical protein TNCV_1094061 [Trichonephila clavipes]|uniref:Uncharacterized protein n=1 Tax=Trichonephila clavipes TaxID=2585209 RepID=A0A8X6UUS6_TRICX|nr:hypothetical protein TNCV_1094061 [Trichonephila clavipes]